MGNRARLLKASETKRQNPQTPRDAQGRIERLGRKRAREGRRLEGLEEGTHLHTSTAVKVVAMNERIGAYTDILGRLTETSDSDEILDGFPIGKEHKKLATQVVEEVGVSDLSRTNRLLTALKKAGRLDNEVTSLMVDGRRSRQRWWWRVK